MELLGGDILVSAPEMSESAGRVAATADFVAATGKPFALNPGDIRLTLIGARDAVEYQGCTLVE